MSEKIMLKNVRLSYEHIFNPSSFDPSAEPKYSATFIIPKDHPSVPALKKALSAAGAEKFGNVYNGTIKPRGYSCALKDADVDTTGDGDLLSEANPEYKGCYVLRADSTRRPVTIDRHKAAVTEDDGIIYSGCYVNASLAAAGYTYQTIKKGVKCYLNGIQFVADGERFGSNALDDFDEMDDDFDDPLLG